jgi:hypothetical protein
MQKFNHLLDWVSQYLADRKGLLPVIGVLLIGINFALQFFPLGWLTESNLFLHLGVILAILGFLLAWAL